MNRRTQYLIFLLVSNTALAQWFTDVTDTIGLTLEHQSAQTVLAIEDEGMNQVLPLVGIHNRAQLLSSWLAAGVAAGDYDGDGWDDLFVIGGDAGFSQLYRNVGDGTFTNVTTLVGLHGLSGWLAGATFVDYDGDGDLDLFVGSALGDRPKLFRNDLTQSGIFTDVFDQAFSSFDENVSPNTWGAAFADFNQDGCLDAFLPHSLTPSGPYPPQTTGTGSTQHFWQGNCQGGFVDVSVSWGFSIMFFDNWDTRLRKEQTFTGNFSDVNADGWLDVLITGDIGTSLVLLNLQGQGVYNYTNPIVVNDETAMGAVVGDLNQDGHMDWFSSNVGAFLSGNRLYFGEGNGQFSNVTAASGVQEGHWGWGSCLLDVNLDRWPDIFHVNGFYYDGNENPDASSDRFSDTPAVLFMANGDGTFTESASAYTIADAHEGRGVSCFDYDHDGDLDVAISNYKGPFKFYRNDMNVAQINYLNVRLQGFQHNTQALGARVELVSETPGETGVLIKEIYAGNNFVSSNPAEAHFGLGGWQGPFTIRVIWPDRDETTHHGVSGNQRIVLDSAARHMYKSGFE